MPARWPSTRGRCRCAAQRPLPSMITATCRGSRSKSTCRASASSGDPGGTTREDVFKRHASGRSQTSMIQLTEFSKRSLHADTEPTSVLHATRNRPCGGAVGRPARGRAMPGCRRSRRRPAPEPDVDQRADDVADHVAQEAVAVDAHHQRLVGRLAAAPVDAARSSARCRCTTAAGALERREVVACRRSGAAASRIALEVERLRHVPDVAAQERRRRTAR